MSALDQHNSPGKSIHYWPCGKWAHNYRLQYKFCTIIIKYQSRVKSSFTSLLHVLLRLCIIILFEIGAFMHWIYINLIMWLCGWRKTWDMGLWSWFILLCREFFLLVGLHINVIRWKLAMSLLEVNNFLGDFSCHVCAMCNIHLRKLPNRRFAHYIAHKHNLLLDDM